MLKQGPLGWQNPVKGVSPFHKHVKAIMIFLKMNMNKQLNTYIGVRKQHIKIRAICGK